MARKGNLPGIGRAPLSERGDDLYETPPAAVHALLRVEALPKVIWEPACGPGSIVKVLRGAGYRVQPAGNAPIGDKGLFPEVANLGRGPPVFHEKTGHEENPGPAQSRKDFFAIAAQLSSRKSQSCDPNLEALWDRVCAVRAVSDAPRLGDDPQAWPALSEFIAAVDEAERDKTTQMAR